MKLCKHKHVDKIPRKESIELWFSSIPAIISTVHYYTTFWKILGKTLKDINVKNATAEQLKHLLIDIERFSIGISGQKFQ